MKKLDTMQLLAIKGGDADPNQPTGPDGRPYEFWDNNNGRPN